MSFLMNNSFLPLADLDDDENDMEGTAGKDDVAHHGNAGEGDDDNPVGGDHNGIQVLASVVPP